MASSVAFTEYVEIHAARKSAARNHEKIVIEYLLLLASTLPFPQLFSAFSFYTLAASIRI